MLKRVYITIKKSLNYPQWDNPVNNWRRIRKSRKQLVKLPGAKELLKAESRNGWSLAIFVYGGLILWTYIAIYAYKLYIYLVG